MPPSGGFFYDNLILIHQMGLNMIKKHYVNWFGVTEKANIYILTDNKQQSMIREILSDMACLSMNILNLENDKIELKDLKRLNSEDILIVSLSIDTFIYKGYNKLFSPFKTPRDLICKYIFIRLDITAKSLKEGLSTEKALIKDEIAHYMNIDKDSKIQVTAPSGTDISFQINGFSTCSHFIDDNSKIAFLPPSELEAGICLGTANGTIVVDITVGQINQYGKWLGHFGLVDEPVKLLVSNNKIVDVLNNKELKIVLFNLEEEARMLVELGIGLSKMNPTGIIGIDESMIRTCHFGIGDGSCVNIENRASIHLDVVLDNPRIEILKKNSKMLTHHP